MMSCSNIPSAWHIHYSSLPYVRVLDRNTILKHAGTKERDNAQTTSFQPPRELDMRPAANLLERALDVQPAFAAASLQLPYRPSSTGHGGCPSCLACTQAQMTAQVQISTSRLPMTKGTFAVCECSMIYIVPIRGFGRRYL